MSADNIEYIGLDLGKARTGFARGASIARVAEPLFTIPADETLNKLIELINSNQAGAVVVGLPRNMDGNDTEQTNWVRNWVKDAKSKISIPFYFQDEALTSKIAEAKKIKPDEKLDIDAISAGIILQDFLNSSEAERRMS